MQQTLSHANSSVSNNRVVFDVSGGGISDNTNVSSTWIVYVGGGTPDMSVMSMGFFPEIITIDAGDNITFVNNSSEVHTVTFLSGNPPINPLSPEADMRIGGDIYNGTGIVSSGMLLPGENYTLTFTTPGIYIYRCNYHAGMMGVVIVNPKGTPYPMTQAQYNKIAQLEESQSIAQGESLFQQVNLPATPGPNGTTIWYIDAGVMTPAASLVNLNPVSSDNISGFAQLSIIPPGLMKVEVNLIGLKQGVTYNVQIFTGAAEAGGKMTYTLNPITGNSNGTGSSITMLKIDPLDPYIPTSYDIPAAGWYINVSNYKDTLALGDVIAPSASVMRFLPTTLTIHVGDTVVWTQDAPDEVHTITFVPQGMGIPEFGDPLSLIQIGGHIFNGSGYYNSGPLIPGQSYNLTFITPGIYTYVCLLHDNMGMVGTIIVLPKTFTNNQNMSIILNQMMNMSNQISQLSSKMNYMDNKITQFNSVVNGLENSNNLTMLVQQGINSKISTLNTVILILIALVIILILANIILIFRKR
ncbi:cupredoxin domain-containing protein [Saccharolobus shibatae]|uniref:Copper binding protein, plastocyanin/azurin family n=1 Tax=Saccharolobus shibatae TaxID=2286 RepID=A0A8F5BZ56_9CREN|nr:plastocyanin/azurin family copper-binding protein [Saccharolobus shibatae]QXJ34159.1 Copper binding protein, plastocyanin/azurin family [Saccharolobus shibatae]